MKKTENGIQNKKMKRILVGTCSVFALSLLAAGGYTYYKMPVNYVSLDINPSVEIGLNAFDKVVDVEAANTDGQALIQENNLLNLSVEEAIDSLVQEATDQGFVKEDGSTVIAVTAESDNEEKAQELQQASSNGVNLAMSAKNSIATVYSDCSDLAVRTEAKEMGISPGKYKLIKMMQSLDSDITVEQYKDAKVSEIMTKAAELVQNSNDTANQGDETATFIEKVKATEQESTQNQVKAAEKEKENNYNSNTDGSTQNQNQEQEQNQNGEAVASGSQVKGAGSAQQGDSSTQGQNAGTTQQGSSSTQGKGTGSAQQSSSSTQNQNAGNSSTQSQGSAVQQGAGTTQEKSVDTSQQSSSSTQGQNAGSSKK